MANKVASILTALGTQASTTLGSTYQEIRFVQDVSRNDGRIAKLGYGFRPLGAVPNEENNIFGSVTLDHTFELIMTDVLTRNASNTEVETKLQTMHNKADEIWRDIVYSTLSVSGVLNIDNVSLGEGEITEDNKLVVLRMQFVVTYRNAI